MKFTQITTTTLLLLNVSQSAPFDFGKFLNGLTGPLFGQPSSKPSTPITQPINPNPSTNQPQQPQQPQQSQQPQQPQQSQQPSENNNENKNGDYDKLSGFLKSYGADIGTVEKPKIEKTAPSSNQPGSFGIMGVGDSSGIQGYLDKNAQLLNDMLNNPDKKFNVGSMFNFPVQNAASMMRIASGVNTNEVSNSKVQGESLQSRVNAQGGEVNLYTLVDLGVDFIYDNKPLYNAVLDLAVAFLKAFPFFLDVVFRIIEKINPYFKPDLITLIMNFLYNYEAHSPPRWIKITDLIRIFLDKDLNISARALRNIIAVASKNPV